MTQVYGGKGKVKVRRRLWGAAEEKDPKKYSVKYLGPEKAASVLEKALQSVKVKNASLFDIISYFQQILRPQINFLLRICREKVVCGNSLSVWKCQLCLLSDI